MIPGVIAGVTAVLVILGSVLPTVVIEEEPTNLWAEGMWGPLPWMVTVAGAVMLIGAGAVAFWRPWGLPLAAGAALAFLPSASLVIRLIWEQMDTGGLFSVEVSLGLGVWVWAVAAVGALVLFALALPSLVGTDSTPLSPFGVAATVAGAWVWAFGLVIPREELDLVSAHLLLEDLSFGVISFVVVLPLLLGSAAVMVGRDTSAAVFLGGSVSAMVVAQVIRLRDHSFEVDFPLIADLGGHDVVVCIGMMLVAAGLLSAAARGTTVWLEDGTEVEPTPPLARFSGSLLLLVIGLAAALMLFVATEADVTSFLFDEDAFEDSFEELEFEPVGEPVSPIEEPPGRSVDDDIARYVEGCAPMSERGTPFGREVPAPVLDESGIGYVDAPIGSGPLLADDDLVDVDYISSYCNSGSMSDRGSPERIRFDELAARTGLREVDRWREGFRSGGTRVVLHERPGEPTVVSVVKIELAD